MLGFELTSLHYQPELFIKQIIKGRDLEKKKKKKTVTKRKKHAIQFRISFSLPMLIIKQINRIQKIKISIWKKKKKKNQQSVKA